MQTRRTFAASACLVALAVKSAQAHAILQESDPVQDGVVPKGFVGITLRFNSRIDRSRSRLLLIAADRQSLPMAIANGGPPDIVHTGLDLAPGKYTVRWSVLATDGHLTRGDLRFEVKDL